MHRRLLILSGLALAACGGSPDLTTPEPEQIGDRDPVDWQGRAPQRFAVHGIDVSRFQQQVDWPAARRAGVQFAFIKATEGGDLHDPMFRDHWRDAHRASIPRGAYHFFYFCTPAEVQARWFIRHVPRDYDALPPVLDLEWNAFSPTCQKRPPGDVVRREARLFLDMAEQHYGRRPIIYTTPQFYRDTGMAQMRGEEFWLRSTAKTLRESYPGQDWRFWQYSGTGIVPGIAGNVDLNAFSGTSDQWHAWMKARRT